MDGDDSQSWMPWRGIAMLAYVMLGGCFSSTLGSDGVGDQVGSIDGDGGGSGNGDGDGDSGAMDACREAIDKLQACGLLTEGYVSCPGGDALARVTCETECILGSSCQALNYDLCGIGDSTGELQRCIGDCSGGEHVCGDGFRIPGTWRCDAVPDCSDASDERDCAGRVYYCADGQPLQQPLVCDGSSDCFDAGDEQGCPTVPCADGTSVPHNARCNGMVDCRDGSDEQGCAQPQCRMPEPFD